MNNSTVNPCVRQTDKPSCLSAADIVGRIRISDVYHELTGIEPRRTTCDAWRAAATGGDNQDRISGDDSRGVWHDFRDDTGGGVLDLIISVRGGTRADALHWAAEFAGVPLDDKPLSADDRERWAKERRELERELPDARYWRRAAVSMAEELLDGLKAALIDPMLPQPRIGEIADVDGMLGRLRRMDGALLVAEYKSWREQHPGMTGLMVRAARTREQAERRAVLAYLQRTGSGRAAA